MYGRRIVSVAAALALVVAIAACSETEKEANAGQASETGAATSSATSSATGSPTGSTETASPSTTSGGDGTFEGGSGKLPEGFPESVPIPDGAEPVYSFGGSDGYSAWFASEMSLEGLRSFFDGKLPANGWTIENRIDGHSKSGTYTIWLIRGNGFNGSIVAGKGGGGTGAFTGEWAFYVLLNRE
jgi:hypothetical protein